MNPSLSLDKNQALQTNMENEQTIDTPKTYDMIIETLQRGNGWGYIDHLYLYQGFWFSPVFLRGTISAQEQFIARPNDIILCSAPKTGTTWLKALAFAIVTRDKFDTYSSPLLTTVPHECIPFLEIDLVQNLVKRDPKLPLLATHVPYTLLPKSIISSRCKVVYIYREPKDSFVSLWHFTHKLTPQDREPITLEEAFRQFKGGVSLCGPFWDHVLGYQKASLEHPKRIFVVKYEDMKTDCTNHVKKLAEFLGYPFTLEEEKDGIIENIVKLCSFENLSGLEVNKGGVHRFGGAPNEPPVVENSMFFRKGTIGDWKNYLTTEMASEMDNITVEKFGPYGIK